MNSPRRFARLGAILSLLGGVLIIYGMFFLPMVIGTGGGSVTPHSAWEVADFFLHYMCGPASVVLALPLLLMLVVLGMSVVSLFQELSPAWVRWRYRAALAALGLQLVLGLFMVFIYTFGFDTAAGFWIVLLGFVVMLFGTTPRLPIFQPGRRP